MTNASNATEYRTYINPVFEVDGKPGKTTYIHYLKAGGQTIGLFKSINDFWGAGDSNQTRYLHRDHLGSITAITDETAQVVEQLSYDAHGKRRQPTWDDAVAQVFSSETNRCFTGHQYLDDVGLIHMGGRVYDPDLGRFLSPDPFIQQVGNQQNFNRYSYVLNNPLSYTDPSGFFFKSLFKAIGKLVKGVVKTVVGAVKAVANFVADNIKTIAAIGVHFIPGINVVAAGFLSGFIASGGNLKAGIIGAITAGAFDYIGGLELSFVEKAVAHGTVGGVSSELQGGSFLSGFASAGVAQVIGGNRFVRGLDKTSQGIVRIIAGGLSSVAGGGKFKNGAITASFAYAFNELRHEFEYKQYEKTFKEHRQLRQRVNDFASNNPDSNIDLSRPDAETIAKKAYYDGRIAKAMGIEYVDAMAGYADSFIRHDGLSSRVFNFEGNTYLGGEVNYIAVGAFNVAYGDSVLPPSISKFTSSITNYIEVPVWNIGQFTGFVEDRSGQGEWHNITSIPDSVFWSNFGSSNAY